MMSYKLDEILVAAIQISSVPRDIETNLRLIEKAIENACTDKPLLNLVVLPELVTTGFILGSDTKDFADYSNGLQFVFLASIAKNYQIHIAYGYIERGKSGKIYDSQAMISDTGELLANYQKIHLTEHEYETFSPGQELVIADTKFGKIGMMICWDIAFPELARLYSLKGCNLLVVSSAWGKPYGYSLRHFAISRSMDNSIGLIVSNTSGSSSGFGFVGESAIYDSTGRIVNELDDNPGCIISKVDFDRQEKYKNNFYSMLEERRTDIYGIVDKKTQEIL
ncbi:MAG: carbon-nitrogen hydrolase family protein [Ostreibacterium sp.]